MENSMTWLMRAAVAAMRAKWVKAADKTVSTMKKEVYLLPGQEFVYDGHTGKVTSFKLM
jgi:hypothetical protein